MMEQFERRLKKRTWRDHVMTVEIYHLKSLSTDPYWSLRKTAEVLGRSVGAISQDLRLSLALRIYPEVGEFKNKNDALEYLRERGKCLMYPCKEWSQAQRDDIVESLLELVK